MQSYNKAWLALFFVLMLLLAGCQQGDRAAPTPPEGYESYESQTLEVAFNYPSESGVAEYPAFGRMAIFEPEGNWTISMVLVNHRNEHNVAPDFEYRYGMRPEDLLNFLRAYSEFGTPETAYQSLPGVGGEALYVRIRDSTAGFVVIGATGTPEHLLLFTGEAAPGQEETLTTAFINVLASARFAEPESEETEMP